jgi:hypothetical protein
VAAEGEAGRFIDRLETAIGEHVGAGRSVRLAFSGGLGSLLVAAVARKRCNLSCLIAATESAPDLERASVLRSYLDYHLEVVRLSADQSLAFARTIARDHPRWTAREILDAVPILAIAPNGGRGLLAGHGSRRVGVRARRWLAREGVVLPILASMPQSSATRPRLIAAGRVLGIPYDFLRVASRSPEVGSGIGLVMREEARRERVPLRDLLRPR